MMTAPGDHSFVLGLIHLSTHRTLPTYLNYHAGNSFMLATESKRPRKSVSCPGARDQMDKPGLRRNQNHATRGNYILPPASERRSLNPLQGLLPCRALDSEMDSPLRCFSTGHLAPRPNKIYSRWEATHILLVLSAQNSSLVHTWIFFGKLCPCNASYLSL